jgi:electron transfer flavoprotein alpha subunit
LRIAVLAKQVPAIAELEYAEDGRLRRDGVDTEMNAYCRRAVSKGVTLANATGGTCTVFTLGPPAAQDVLREAIAWGATQGVHVCDPAFAGSDTFATARALVAALEQQGPFDLVIVGRNSVDSDTGQVGAQVAELLGLPFIGPVLELALTSDGIDATCDAGDGLTRLSTTVPVVLAAAERLCEPCKKSPADRAQVRADAIKTLSAADLGTGPWGQAGSLTLVGHARPHGVSRMQLVLSGPVEGQVIDAVKFLTQRGVGKRESEGGPRLTVPSRSEPSGPIIAVIIEPSRANVSREMLGSAALLAAELGGQTVAIGELADEGELLSADGADALVDLVSTGGPLMPEDHARAIAEWARTARPWAVLLPSTSWGREVGGRIAAALGAGLTGDAVGLEIDDGRLIAWKPAFGGQMVAAITATSDVQMATIRAGMLPRLHQRSRTSVPRQTRGVDPRGRVRVHSYSRNDDAELLSEAQVVIGVGRGVDPGDYGLFAQLEDGLGAVLGATRKVTDAGYLPHSRQVGITGKTIEPDLFISVGASGRFNHIIAIGAAKTVLAINSDPEAEIFGVSDVGIVGDYRDVIPLLTGSLLDIVTAGTGLPSTAKAAP